MSQNEASEAGNSGQLPSPEDFGVGVFPPYSPSVWTRQIPGSVPLPF